MRARSLAQVLAAILLGLGLGWTLAGSTLELRLSAIVIFVVPAALLMQVLLLLESRRLFAETVELARRSAQGRAGAGGGSPALPAFAPDGKAAFSGAEVAAAPPVASPSARPPISSSGAGRPSSLGPPAAPGPNASPSPAGSESWPAADRPAPWAEEEDPQTSARRTREILDRLDLPRAFEPAGGAGGGTAPASAAPSPAEKPRGDLPASEVVRVWNHYLLTGNGRFDAKGLKDFLAAAGIEAVVLPADHLVGMGKPVLGVAAPDSRERVWLLPDFTCAPRALGAWFDLDVEIRSATRMNRLIRAAELRRNRESYELAQKGALE